MTSTFRSLLTAALLLGTPELVMAQPYLQQVLVEGHAAKPASQPKPRSPLQVKDLAEAHPKNKIETGNLVLYFGSNSWTLKRNDKQDIRALLHTLESGTPLLLEGYADHRGPDDWNMELSQNRAQGIEAMIQGGWPGKYSTQITAYGESKATQRGKDSRSTQQDRVVRIIPGQSPIARGLDLLTADYYLIDSSGSMNEPLPDGRSKWEEVATYRFPAGPQVYTFGSGSPAVPLARISPNGDTPLYRSLHDLISQAKSGKAITVLSDGEDTQGGYTPEQLAQQAKQKQLSLSFVGIGLLPDTQHTLTTMAQQTGGKVYLAR